jgi:hypothetical protein
VLVVTGVIPASETVDWTALRWHAFFWDPAFLLWGVLLAAAAHRAGSSHHADRGEDRRPQAVLCG